jgi:cardiolipin synthase
LRRILRNLVLVVRAILLLGWWKVLRVVEGDNWPLPPDAITAAQAREATEAFARRGDVRRDDVAIPYARTTASRVEPFNSGAAFLPAMLRDIEGARSSVHLMMFALVPGEWGARYVDALVAKARQGVDVRLTVDRYGSKVYRSSEDLYRRLADAGVQVVVNDIFPIQGTGVFPGQSLSWSQDEIGQADHRKMLVIDGRVGWMGGGGIEDHFFDDTFHDLFVRVEGNIVLQMQAVFLTSFHAYGGPVASEPGSLVPYFPEPADPGTIPVTLLQNIPGGFLPGTEASRDVIERATKRIEILNPYFTDPGIIDRVVDAAERGVDVRLLVSAKSNNAPADAALTHHYPRLMDAGIEILEYPGTMHEKLTIADDRVIIGTINYDAWALYRNLEIALLFEDAGLATAFTDASVTPDAARCMPAHSPDGSFSQWFWSKLVYFL